MTHLRRPRKARASWFFVIAASLSAALPVSATATFPGRNGQIAFGTTQGLFLERVDGSARKVLLRGRDVRSPAWSADGRRIAVEIVPRAKTATGSDLYVVDARTGRLSLVARGSGAELRSASWSPSGREIAYIRGSHRRDGELVGAQLWVARVDGTARRRLKNVVGPTDSEWSPDGKQIAYASQDDDIYGIGVRGGTPRRIADLPEDECATAISWAPDARALAFWDFACGTRSLCEGCFDIARVDVGFGQIGRLDGVTFGHASQLPVWSPDGRSILYCRERGVPEEYPDYASAQIRPDGTGKRLRPRGRCAESWQPRP